jgi:exportin-2 (importin alpha re-exporter)
MEKLTAELERSLSSDRATRQAAEAALSSAAGNPGFTGALLQVVSGGGAAAPAQIAAAVYFKNHVTRQWDVAEGDADPIAPAERDAVRGGIVALMLGAQASAVRELLLEAVAVIARVDFPERWPGLLPELVAKLATQDWAQINGCLSAMHAVFRGYTSESGTIKLAGEMKYALPIVQEPLTAYFTAACAHVDTLATAGAAARGDLEQVFRALRTMCRVFHCLTHPTLPEYFENHLAEWMAGFHKFLATEPGALATEGGDEEDPVTQLQATICDCINLFVAKYEEEIQPHLQACTQDVWTLLMRSGQDPKFDGLVASAISFLTAVSRGVHHAILGEENTLRTLCEAVIVPNVSARQADVESYEDTPVEYMRGDVEGSDAETRRRAACDLVRGLCTHYERQAAAIFSGQIANLVAAYRAAPANWRAKDTAVQLMIAVGSRSSTAALGTTRVAEGAEVKAFFGAEIAPELSLEASGRAASPLVTAGCLKFLTVFRGNLGRDTLVAVLPGVVSLLASTDHVIMSYAALAIDRLLTVRTAAPATAANGAAGAAGVAGAAGTGGATKVLTGADLRPHLQTLLVSLLSSLDRPGPAAHNEYAMRCAMRVVSVAQADIAPLVAPLIGKLAEITARVAANPTHPTFNHYLFESISAIIAHACAADRSLVPAFEGALYPIFQRILEADIAEFTPYVFQVMSQLLEKRTELAEVYKPLLPMLLQGGLWTLRGNVIPLSRLLVAYLAVGGELVHSSGAVPKYLGVVQKLISSQGTEDGAFYLLSGMFARLPLAAYQDHFAALLQVLLVRLQSNKTVRFMKALVALFSLFVVRNDASTLVNAVDAVQPGLFLNLLSNVWLPSVCRIEGKVDRKLCTVALARLLTACPEMLNENYAQAWPRVLATSVALASDAVDTSTRDAEADEADAFFELDDAGYNNVYAALHHASAEEQDHVPEVTDAKAYLDQQVAAAAKANPAIAQHVSQLTANGN